MSGPIPGPAAIIGPSKKSTNIISIVNINNNLKVPLLQENEQVDNVNLSEVAKDLSNFDNLGIKIDNRQVDDIEALESYQCNMTKDPLTNSYIVGFPWIGNVPPAGEELESNYHMVKKRFDSTMKKLDKEKEKLKEYASVHQKEIENGVEKSCTLQTLYKSFSCMER